MDLIFKVISCMMIMTTLALGIAGINQLSNLNLKKELTAYSLVSCNAVHKCEIEYTFIHVDDCLFMKEKLEDMSKMNAYICEKVGR